MWPSYYVRTDDPWLLAGAAMVGDYRNHDIEIEGEADYTISATIYNPPYERADESFYLSAVAESNVMLIEDDEDGGNDGWRYIEHGEASRVYDSRLDAAIGYCEDNDIEPESWCNVNGAWVICEVFPIEDMDDERSEAPRYDSLAEGFNDATLIAARAL